MRTRLLAGLAVALAAATLASTAAADVFVVVKPATVHAAHLPSSALPNFPGSIVVPANLSTPPAQPMTLDSAQLQQLWQQAGAAYGIPWSVLAAINEIESGFGRNMGPSSAGAIGWMQFMPSTWLEWGVDADGNGVADPWNPYDAVYAAARYLAASGGTTDIARAIYSYNHATWYVQRVLALAQEYAQGQGATFTTATAQPSLGPQRQAVAKARSLAAAAEAAVRKLERRISRADRRANGAALLSTRLALQAQAGRLREQLPAARARAAQTQSALHAAQQTLQQMQASAAATPSFSAAASPVLDGAPVASWAGGDWGVFSPSTYAGTDQGVDFTGSGPIPALAAGRVTAVRSESIIEGGSYPVVAYQLEDGPYAGNYVYVAENFVPTVQVGQQVSPGQTVGVANGSYPYIEVGFASGPDGSAAAPLYPDPHGPKPAGAAMWGYIQSLLGDPSVGPVRTLQAVQAPASGPVFSVLPNNGQAPVVMFNRP